MVAKLFLFLGTFGATVLVGLLIYTWPRWTPANADQVCLDHGGWKWVVAIPERVTVRCKDGFEDVDG